VWEQLFPHRPSVGTAGSLNGIIQIAASVGTGKNSLFHHGTVMEQGKIPVPSRDSDGTGKKSLSHHGTVMEQGKNPCSITGR
jgi:hypothetical protein